MIKKNLGIISLFITDVFAIFIVLQTALLIRKDLLPRFSFFPEFTPQTDIKFFWWVFYVWLFFLAYEGLYTKRFSFWDEIKILWKVSLLSTLGIFTVLYLGKIGEQVSRTIIVLSCIISIPLMPLIRINAKKLLILTGILKKKALILGAGETGRLIFNALQRDKNLGLTVVGFLDDDPAKIGTIIKGIKVHAGVDKAQKYIGRCGIEDVIIAMPGCNKDRLISLINHLQHKANNILLIPDLFGISVLGTNLQHFFQEQAIGLEVRNNLAEPLNRIIKNMFDFTISILLLVMLIIPIAIIALAIRIGSSGAAIYSHERIGKDNKPFKCYKFRTMYSNADIRLHSLLENSPESKVEWENTQKLRNDPRVTRIGRFLRQTSLDELPQILNVLKSEMSLVGPRPVTQGELNNHYKDQAQLCFGVLPGITGLWQVSGRSNTSYSYRIALDSWYVRNWNLWLDIVILFKTIRVVVNKDGAV